MTFDQLRIFVTVVNAMSMTRAAEQLHLSQPAVSAAVAALENRYQVRLFDRVGRGLELTEAGRIFVCEARAVLAQVEEARRVFDDLAGYLRGEVRIAASQTVATYWLPGRMARFAFDNPKIAMPLSVGNSAQAAAAVLAGEADIAFVEGDVCEVVLEQVIVGGDRLGIYSAPSHPMSGRRLERLDLRRAVWVLREPGSGTRDHFAAELERYEIDVRDLNILLELPSNGAVLEAIEAGELVAPVSDLAAASRLQAGTIERLDFSFARREFSMLRHRDRRLGNAAQAFVGSLAIG